MNFTFCVLFLIFSQVASSIQNGSYSFINYYIRFILENQLRQEMAVGLPSLDIPSLEPLYLHQIPIKLGAKKNYINCDLFDTQLIGLSTFILTDFQANLINKTLNFEMTFPHLLVRGRYVLKGKLWRVFHLEDTSNFTVALTDVLIEAYAVFTFVREVQIDQLELNSNFGKVTTNFGKGKFYTLFNRIVSKHGQFIFNLFKPDLMDRATYVLKQHINDKMKKFKLKDFLSKYKYI